ncbi:pantoate kinase [Methanobacterium sp. ACI-7]|uniref:pantoate kinase n=1 Tax=unclassified Methanobacterium TaxID=2627676 RepID=UPI0039C1EE6E
MNCSVFVPSHITGFFEIVDSNDPLKKGSRGAGVVMDKGVITEVKLGNGNGINIKVNGREDPKNITITEKVIEIIERNYNLDFEKININHKVEVPIGAGFGTSAAFALGAILAISNIFKLPLTFNKAAQIAHLAELEMSSGLGDVIGEISGGMVLRLKEGAPGIGVTDRLILKESPELYVISKTFGEIKTSDIIEDSVHKERINSIGRDLLLKLIKKPEPQNFMKLSLKFAEKTELMSNDVLETVKILEEETWGASMAMLGNTAFAISETPDTSIENTLVAKLNYSGLRFL